MLHKVVAIHSILARIRTRAGDVIQLAVTRRSRNFGKVETKLNEERGNPRCGFARFGRLPLHGNLDAEWSEWLANVVQRKDFTSKRCLVLARLAVDLKGIVPLVSLHKIQNGDYLSYY